jgi:hypothetical protein
VPSSWRLIGALLAGIGIVVLPAPPGWAGVGAGSSGEHIWGRASYSPSEYRGRSTPCTWEVLDHGYEYNPGETRTVGGQRLVEGVTYAFYRRTCEGASVFVWVPLVSVGDLVPGALEYLEARLPRPDPTLHPVDPEFGWVYVQVPVDFRTAPATLEPVSVTVSVDGPTPVWVTVTALPSGLRFMPGDGGGASIVACGPAGATAEYVGEVPGECSYTYRKASSTSGDGSRFDAEMQIAWDVTYVSSAGPGVLSVAPTSTGFPIVVAEVKGLVVCTGARPEQGGC